MNRQHDHSTWRRDGWCDCEVDPLPGIGLTIDPAHAGAASTVWQRRPQGSGHRGTLNGGCLRKFASSVPNSPGLSGVDAKIAPRVRDFPPRVVPRQEGIIACKREPAKCLCALRRSYPRPVFIVKCFRGRLLTPGRVDFLDQFCILHIRAPRVCSITRPAPAQPIERADPVRHERRHAGCKSAPHCPPAPESRFRRRSPNRRSSPLAAPHRHARLAIASRIDTGVASNRERPARKGPEPRAFPARLGECPENASSRPAPTPGPAFQVRDVRARRRRSRVGSSGTAASTCAAISRKFVFFSGRSAGNRCDSSPAASEDSPQSQFATPARSGRGTKRSTSTPWESRATLGRGKLFLLEPEYCPCAAATAIKAVRERVSSRFSRRRVRASRLKCNADRTTGVPHARPPGDPEHLVPGADRDHGVGCAQSNNSASRPTPPRRTVPQQVIEHRISPRRSSPSGPSDFRQQVRAEARAITAPHQVDQQGLSPPTGIDVITNITRSGPRSASGKRFSDRCFFVRTRHVFL